MKTVLNLHDVVEGWIAGGKPQWLPARELDYLRQEHQAMAAAGQACFWSPNTADGFCCGELELEPGATEAEVIAALLDFVDPLSCGDARLPEMQELMRS